ncbi:Membrane dipeptidase (Peptidase family M19) [Polystyrenella longa]|uniref:Membrane dipeptidase (Peptidase family M19) n=1 Tax=Polystyrenella longa TaxID=2528007 RepID=A0A518CUE6_9PLAN|nr:membrane dipeptidase [Polystyrenella longa]QDU82859.1 Membrane dipeptidase (Peptidase family M19) [Polystyrenella longa]
MDRRTFLCSTAALTAATSALSAQTTSASDDVAELNPVQALTERLPPRMQHVREVALNMLKPSASELEQGLQLHADSLVFDSYSFAPRAAVDGDAIAAAIEAGASHSEVEEMREDMMMTRFVSNLAEQQEYLNAWRVSGVTSIFQNAGQEGQDPLRLLKRLARFTYATDILKDYVSKAAVPADVEAAKAAGKHCLYMTGNGVPLAQQWISIPEELQYVRIFYELGIRMMHLTYQRRNMIGDGCGEKSDAGLSDFGREAIAEMNRVGIIPDCAHSGWRTSREAAEVSGKPVVASHSTAGGIYPHFRSKPDDVVKAIVDSGGYVGICCIPRYLRGKGDLTTMLDHVDYIAKKFGVDHVAIGTDIAWTSQYAGEENRKIPKRPRSREPFRSLWPSDDYKTTSEATDSLSWINWPLYTVGLLQRGYSEEDIRKIIGGNVMRVAKETIQISES